MLPCRLAELDARPLTRAGCRCQPIDGGQWRDGRPVPALIPDFDDIRRTVLARRSEAIVADSGRGKGAAEWVHWLLGEPPEQQDRVVHEVQSDLAARVRHGGLLAI